MTCVCMCDCMRSVIHGTHIVLFLFLRWIVYVFNILRLPITNTFLCELLFTQYFHWDWSVGRSRGCLVQSILSNGIYATKLRWTTNNSIRLTHDLRKMPMLYQIKCRAKNYSESKNCLKKKWKKKVKIVFFFASNKYYHNTGMRWRTE